MLRYFKLSKSFFVYRQFPRFPVTMCLKYFSTNTKKDNDKDDKDKGDKVDK